jgi:hypothetical protein
MTILIITGKDDVHADLVIPYLDDAAGSHNVVRLNTDDFATNATFTATDTTCAIHLKDSDRTLVTEQVRAVWYRKPVPIRAPVLGQETAIIDFANSEFEALLRSLYGLVDHGFWVSPFWNIRAASQKLPNLLLASRLGLRTPKTLVTNHEREAQSFGEACAWKIIAKPFALATFRHAATGITSWDTFAAPVDEATFQELRTALPIAPVILQEYIEKKLELRATVIGDQVITVAIDSQSHSGARHDWRAAEVEEMQHEAFQLPETVQRQLLSFNRQYGLQFSTFDLILTPDGEFIWLECNPNGQWRWIEDLTGQPIARAIADLLIAPDRHRLTGGRCG